MIPLTSCIFCKSHASIIVQKQSGHDEYLKLLSKDHKESVRSWIRCLDCGLARQSNVLDDAETTELYLMFRNRTIRSENPDEYFDRITSLPAVESENFQRCIWMKDEIPSSGSILDIGCGGGVFLHQFIEFYGSNWKVAGVEPTVEYAELASRRLGASIEPGMFDDRMFSGKLFDLITINHVLEHIIDPIVFLRNACRLLKPNGMIYLETPDQSDFGFLPTTHDRFSLQHNWYFRLVDLENFGRRVGLTPVKSETFTSIRNRFNSRVLFKTLASV
jgi:2-polyprenyl-3-methyl-5-hydroxy-6-metoxy-1,4-benzoquinol methylase